MHLHINIGMSYLMLDDIETHFKVPRLSMKSYILPIYAVFYFIGHI